MACCYQSILDLEKCNHYIEGVILNLEASLKEDKIMTGLVKLLGLKVRARSLFKAHIKI